MRQSSIVRFAESSGKMPKKVGVFIQHLRTTIEPLSNISMPLRLGLLITKFSTTPFVEPADRKAHWLAPPFVKANVKFFNAQFVTDVAVNPRKFPSTRIVAPCPSIVTLFGIWIAAVMRYVPGLKITVVSPREAVLDSVDTIAVVQSLVAFPTAPDHEGLFGPAGVCPTSC